MPTRKPKKRGPDQNQQGPDKGKEHPSEPEYDTTPAEVHRDYVRRQLGGGAPLARDQRTEADPALPERYEHGIRQWHKLPGAVRVPPTELTGAEAAQMPANKQDKDSAQTPADKQDNSPER
jgi:hypothetical protein